MRSLFIIVICIALLPALTACLVQSTALPTPTSVISETPSVGDTPTSPLMSGPTPRVTQLYGYQVTQYFQPPLMTINPEMEYQATVRTSEGSFALSLFPESAPKTVNNFVFLAREGFYDDLIFHRVVAGLLIQGGDPTGTGFGGPGYQFETEIDPSLSFDSAGALGMARSRQPNTNGSQFFITVAPMPALNGEYTVFGEVLSGQAVVDRISQVRTDNERPLQEVTILGINIEELEPLN